MKCIICAVESKELSCPGCGFVRPRFVGDPDKYEEMLKGMAEEYAESQGLDAKIGLTVYTYRMTEGQLSEDERQELILVENYLEARIGRILWNQREFARIDPGTSVTLTGFLQKSGRKKTWEVTVKAPDAEGLWRVGIRREEGLRFRLLVGNDRSVVESESLSVRDIWRAQ